MSDVPSIHLQSEQEQKPQVMLPIKCFAVHAVDLLFVEGVPAAAADSSFALVDEMEIDPGLEFDHLVETLVAASGDVVD